MDNFFLAGVLKLLAGKDSVRGCLKKLVYADLFDLLQIADQGVLHDGDEGQADEPVMGVSAGPLLAVGVDDGVVALAGRFFGS